MPTDSEEEQATAGATKPRRARETLVEKMWTHEHRLSVLEGRFQAIDKTVDWGRMVERWVLEILRRWPRLLDWEVLYQGKRNKPGDILLGVRSLVRPPHRHRIVIEVKAVRSHFTMAALEKLVAKVVGANRGAGVAIVFYDDASFDPNLGPCAVGTLGGVPWVATTVQDMVPAILNVLVRIEEAWSVRQSTGP